MYVWPFYNIMYEGANVKKDERFGNLLENYKTWFTKFGTICTI